MAEQTPLAAPEKLTFRQILEHAKERGAERAGERREALRRRILGVKEAVHTGWQFVKKTGERIGRALLIAEELIVDPQIHEEIGIYVRQQIEGGRENLKMRIDEVREDFSDRREKVKNRVEEGIAGIRRAVTERVTRPAMEGAKKIGSAVVKGVETGVMFIEQGKERAREWGGRLQNYFIRQGERVKQGIQIGVAEVRAAGLTLSNIPDHLRARLIEAQRQRHSARTEAERQRYDAIIKALQEQLEKAIIDREDMLARGQSTEAALSNEIKEIQKNIRGRREAAEGLRQAARGLRT